jgi:hypothetical protein
MKIKSVAQLADAANPLNPRKITPEQLKMLADSLRKFGDLSGLILNERTGHLVGGHQRVKELGEAPVKIVRRYKVPTAKGTVAEGYVLFEGERYNYRVVQWDEATEKAAMIAANKHGGDWDFPQLSELLMELDTGAFDLSLTGFSAGELERMVRGIAANDDDEIQPLSKDEIDLLPAHIRMVQLFLTVETLPMFMDQVRTLQEQFATENVTDTVVAAVDTCYHRGHGNDSTDGKRPTTSNSAGLQAQDQNTGQGDSPQARSLNRGRNRQAGRAPVRR